MHDPASWFRKTWFTRRRVRELKNAHNSVTVQNRTHVYMNFFHHKDLGNHLLQLCPKVVKHPVYSGNNIGQGSQTHGPPTLFYGAFALILFHLCNLARLRVEDILNLRCPSSRAVRLKKLCYPRMVTYREFSYRGTEYGRAGTVIRASAVIYVVRSTARNPELTRYSRDLVGYLTSGLLRRLLCSSAYIGR